MKSDKNISINKERIIAEFCNLVKIDSLSFQERKMGDYILEELDKLGFVTEEDDCGKIYEGNCGNIYGFLKGNSSTQKRSILLSSHMDTVAPGQNKVPVIQDDGRITSDGNTVLGADDLSGVVSILEALRIIKEQNVEHGDIEVLFTIAEEAFLLGSNVFDFSKIKSKIAFVLDLDGGIGHAAVQAPTVISYTVHVEGKASHAGFAPEKGINSIVIAANAINKLKQGKLDDETTSNVGIIQGGKARNIVADTCCIQGEVRSLSHNKAIREVEEIESIFLAEADSMGGKAKLEYTFGCIAYQTDLEDVSVKIFKDACEKQGIVPEFTSTFGGSDNNNFARNHISGIVMASGMHFVHSKQEYTTTTELEEAAKLVIEILRSEV